MQYCYEVGSFLCKVSAARRPDGDCTDNKDNRDGKKSCVISTTSKKMFREPSRPLRATILKMNLWCGWSLVLIAFRTHFAPRERVTLILQGVSVFRINSRDHDLPQGSGHPPKALVFNQYHPVARLSGALSGCSMLSSLAQI